MKDEFKNKYLNKQHDLVEMNARPKFPKILKIDTCNVCNYACVFCPQSKQGNKVGCIDDRLCKKIIEDAYNSGSRELCVSMTGEPLLNQRLHEYIKFAKQLGYSYVFFNTNGYLLTKECSERLLDAGIDSIKVSVNSSAKSYELVHGVNGYERVKRNIIDFSTLRRERGSNCKLYISYVAVIQTVDEVDALKQDMGGYVDEIIVMNANNRGGSVSKLEEGLYAGNDEYSFKYPCSQLFNNLYVTAEGYMIICCQDFENLTVIADLNEESISDAWNNHAFVTFREKYLKHELEGTLCYNCINNCSEKVIPLSEKYAFYDVIEQKEQLLYKRISMLQSGVNCK